MKIINALLKYSALFALLIITSCANMVNPNGGEKDIIPPTLVKSNPKNFSTNSTSTKIELNFNEYLNLKDIQQQLIISPGDISVEVNKRGKNLLLELNKKPAENTTYIINFGDAISDYTENNIAKDFKFIFSTGSEIDSLTLKGSIVNAMTKESVKDIIVCLYTDTINDSVVYKQKPDYTVRSNENGQFVFTNLRANQYRIFAIKETNNNKLFDSQEEEIAFIDTNINLTSNNKVGELLLFTEKPKDRKLINKDISYKKVLLTYNKETSISLINNNDNIDTVIYSSKRDSIIVYYNAMPDTSYLYIKENNKIDTLKVKFPKSIKKKEFNVNVDNKIFGKEIIIKSSDKFSLLNSDSLLLKEDSLEVKYKLDQINYNTYKLSYNFDKEKKYVLFLKDSVFLSYQGNKNKGLNYNINFYRDEDVGTLKIKSNYKEPIILELLNERNELVRRTICHENKETQYKNLISGTYKLRIVFDANKNKQWDTGNYLKRIQPEKIIYQTNPIKIRANWDLELEINP